MIACEDYPSLYERQIVKVRTEFPAWLGEWKAGPREFQLHPAYGGGTIAFRNLDDPDKYQSAEFALIAIDELTKNSEKTYTNLVMGSNRWPGIERAQFVGATNPTGVGAPWVRRYWVEDALPKNMVKDAPEYAFVPGLARDNPYLPESYWDRLGSLPDAVRKAWRDGDWYAGVEGLVFPEFTAENITTEEPDPEKTIELAADDGYVDPRAILFIQRTGTQILVFDELYQRSTLAERSVQDVKDRCEENGWPLPDIAIGSPEAKELQARFRLGDIPFRFQSHKIVDGLAVLRRLIQDGNGYRALKVHSRCRNLLWELTEGYQYPEGTKGLHEKPVDGNDHACDALRYWCYVRARR
jgi:phage terminase large subunit